MTLDQAIAAVVDMRVDEIEAAEVALRNLEGRSLDAYSISKLKLLRAAAMNGAQLWSGCIPEMGANTYTLEGQVTAVAAPSELSVTG
ncbi:MAG TPA: hypothetical protein VEX68_21210 [Bryobacteraceae bacterium]|nr:hypothetical protein [Bryobacteraceae bacterium]